MTTNAMNCEYFNERLMAYLEYETDDETRAAIERHSITCVECGALLADLRKLRIESTNLADPTPSRDLWSGIAARIEAPVVPIGTVRHIDVTRSQAMARWSRAALIAASLVAAAGLGYVAAARRVFDAPVSVATAPPAETLAPTVVLPSTRPPDEVVEGAAQPQRSATGGPTVTNVVNSAPRATPAQLAIATLTADYDREISRLRGLIELRRNQLDPVTVAIIEKNLQVIDTAIAECKKAIVRDPASRFLIESLNQSLQTKVELMRTAALLPSRT